MCQLSFDFRFFCGSRTLAESDRGLSERLQVDQDVNNQYFFQNISPFSPRSIPQIAIVPWPVELYDCQCDGRQKLFQIQITFDSGGRIILITDYPYLQSRRILFKDFFSGTY